MKQKGMIETGFVYDLPKMLLSETEFSFVIPAGEQRKASFHISADNGSVVTAQLHSDCHRVILAQDEVSGTDSEVLFGIDTTGLREGDTVSGNILISSNLSETAVPVRAEIAAAGEDAFDPEVKSLEDFANVCQKDLREGFHLFTNPNFRRLLGGKNRKYLALYQGMSHNPVTYQHLEEFLVTTEKKEPITLSLDKQEKAVYELGASQSDTLYIYRNTWGYVRLEVETEGDFLEVEKKVITTDDFIGKVYGLEYILHKDRMGAGRNFGRIRIRSVHQSLEFDVEATTGQNAEITPAAVRSRRISWLLRDYLKLQLHTLDYRTWIDSAAMTVQEMLDDDPEDITAILYMAFLHYSREDSAAAIETLWPLKNGDLKPEGPEERGAYLWLAKAVGLLPHEKQIILPQLRRYLRAKPDSYTLLHLILQETDRDHMTPADLLAFYEECFNAGCTSPFLYLDAWNLLAGEEALLRRVSSFTIAVLSFGWKNGLLTEGLAMRCAFLSANNKTFSRSVYRLLAGSYEKFPNDEILEAVCKLLIKGDPTSPECYPWFAKAVERDIRITRLYEYFMETYDAPASEEIPLPVRMYFATNDTIGERKKALLYASIVLHKKEDETSYMNYSRNIRAFTAEALHRGRIDENLAILYREYINGKESKETAALLARVLFAAKLTVKDRRIRQVVVCHQALAEEQIYRVNDGIAYPRIYSADACILLEDDRHRRFASTVPFTLEKLMDRSSQARHCADMDAADAGVLLYLCKEKAFQMEVSEHNLPIYRMAAEKEAFTPEYRNILRRKILEFDLAHPEIELLPELFSEDAIDAYAAADKAQTAALLIREARFEDAFRVVSQYGYEGVAPELLLRCASRLILAKEKTDDEELLCLAEYVFANGKYDDVLLTYLRDHYKGSVRNLCRLWEKVRDFKIESRSLEERIMLQSVVTKQFPDHEAEILRSFLSREGKVQTAAIFLSYLASYYFLGQRQTDGSVFGLIEKELTEGRLKETVCKLALLKHYSEIGTLTEAQNLLTKQLLKEMDRQGLRFEFYKNLPAELIQAYQIEDKIFIEEQYRPDSRVILHYRLTEQDSEPGEWVSEPMKNVYQGIFGKEFLLFYGETLTYYLSVLTDGTIRNTDSYQLSLVDMDTRGTTRYKLLNRMLEAADGGSRGELQRAVELYRKQEALVDKFLHLCE